MDSINVDKIQALKKYKQQEFINTLMFYPMVALICALFCTSPFWFPCLYSSTKAFFFVSIPQILTFFFNAKSLFILGNLIVVFLLKESKIKGPNSSTQQRKLDDFRDVKQPISLPLVVEHEEVEEEEMNEDESDEVFYDDLEDNEMLEGLVCDEILSEDLNKRAEDFIAMVNKQIRLEANHDRVLLCS
ncbi:hypothetical protein vseg_017280 [Gypsophila vaccaria]